METGDFWLNRTEAEKVVAAANALKQWVVPCREAKKRFDDAAQLLEEVDPDADRELYDELIAELDGVEKRVKELEMQKNAIRRARSQ